MQSSQSSSSASTNLEHTAEDNICKFWFVVADKIRVAKPEDFRPDGTFAPEKMKHQALRSADLALAESGREITFLVEREITFNGVCDGLYRDEYAAVSHRWEKPHLPDPSGVQMIEVHRFLLSHPKIKFIWMDYPCMPQGERTTSEQAEFKRMLQHMNLIYLASIVLILMDRSYPSRFWVRAHRLCAPGRSSMTARALDSRRCRLNLRAGCRCRW